MIIACYCNGKSKSPPQTKTLPPTTAVADEDPVTKFQKQQRPIKIKVIDPPPKTKPPSRILYFHEPQPAAQPTPAKAVAETTAKPQKIAGAQAAQPAPSSVLKAAQRYRHTAAAGGASALQTGELHQGPHAAARVRAHYPP